jgi:hypothetical protein
MNRFWRVWSALLLASTVMLPCFGFVDYVVVTAEIPDAHAVGRWCEELRVAQGEFISIQGKRTVAAALQECDTFQRGRIDGQTWSSKVISLRREAAQLGLPKKELERFPDVRPLPTDYPCYALMLFPDDSWKENKELDDIRKAFSSFGDAIGNKGAAIWFLNEKGQIDVRRALFYCDRFALASGGPYIVVTRHRPDTIRNKEDGIVINCEGISPTRLRSVLGVLESDLRSGRELRKRQLLFSEVKQWLLSEAERQNLSLLGITVSILKGLVK